MKWLSLDTDILQDGKIKSLLQQHGSDGYLVYNYLLTQVASDIDIDNEKNGYLDIGNGNKPQAEVAWDLHINQEQIKEIIETLSNLELIDPESWKDNEIYIPKILERQQTKRFLREQEGGRKGGSAKTKGDRKGIQGGFKGASSHPSRDRDVDKDKDKETTKQTNGGKFDLEEKDNGRYKYPEDFEKIWNHYPFKRGTKKATWRKWRARRKDGVSNGDLLEATKNYQEYIQESGTEEKYVKYGQTFFGPDEHWDEYRDENYSPPSTESENEDQDGAPITNVTEEDKEILGLD